MMAEKDPPEKQTGLTPLPHNLEKVATALTVTVLRELGDCNQLDLAAASGVDNSSLSRYENRKTLPSRTSLAKVSEGVCVPFDVTEGTLLPALRKVVAVKHGLAEPGTAPPLVDALLAGGAQALRPHLGRVVESLLDHAMGPWWQVRPPSAADRQAAAALWAELESASIAQRRLLLDEAPEYWNWALVELVCAESVRAAPSSAKRALELAELAVDIASRVRGEELWCKRVLGYAGVHAGHAQRVGGQLKPAEAEFSKALVLWKAGAAADPGLLDDVRVLSLEASLHLEQRRFADAQRVLNEALASNSGKLRPQLLVKQAYAAELLGDFESAISTLRQAATAVTSGSDDPRFHWVLGLNLCGNLCHLGRFAEAEPHLAEVQTLAAQLGNELDILRTRWVEWKLAAGLGRRDEAIAGLETVRDDFTRLEIAYDAALVTLELAVLYLEGGRASEVKELAVELAWVFKDQGVHSHALAALRLFCDAARQERVSVDLARQLAAYLYRAQKNQELKFGEAGGGCLRSSESVID
jgi:transcriptional regulator with XRE-family HTH domain